MLFSAILTHGVHNVGYCCQHYLKIYELIKQTLTIIKKLQSVACFYIILNLCD